MPSYHPRNATLKHASIDLLKRCKMEPYRLELYRMHSSICGKDNMSNKISNQAITKVTWAVNYVLQCLMMSVSSLKVYVREWNKNYIVDQTRD